MSTPVNSTLRKRQRFRHRPRIAGGKQAGQADRDAEELFHGTRNLVRIWTTAAAAPAITSG